MPRIPRIAQRIALTLVVLLATALVAMMALLDPSAHKAKIEEAASRALGMEVTVNGPMALRWRPTAYLVLRDVRARKAGADIVAAKEAVVGLRLGSLLGGRPQLRSVALHDGTLAIVRDANGRFNFQKDPVPGQARPARDLPDVSFSQATITYSDPRFERRIEARGCQGRIGQLHTAGGERRLLAGLSFDGEAACAEVRSGDMALAEVGMATRAKDGVFDFHQIRTRLFDVQGSGRARADFTGAAAAYQVEYTLPQFPVEQLLKALALKPVATGRMDLTAKLAMHGRTAKELEKTVTGTVSLRGQGLMYHGGNLDERVERFESSQNFNLFDVGAMMLAGPAGLLVTKGYEFVTVAQGTPGKSEIRTLVSDWVVERGVARARDVAMATPANRVAIKGGIDFVNDRFQGMTIAVVDAKGCAKVQQQVKGTLHKPEVEKLNAIEALTAPAVQLLKKGAELIGGESCEVFYAGTVPAPSSPK